MVKEEAALHTRLKKRHNYEEETEKIETFTQQETDKYKKRKQKIRCPLGSEKITEKKKKCC